MKRSPLVLVVALLVAACGLPKSQQPATRAAACAARNQPLTLGVWEFCNPDGGVAQCGAYCAGGRPCVGQMVCRTVVTGYQPACDLPLVGNQTPYPITTGECIDGQGCPPWWQCVTMTLGDGGVPRSYCVPGPSCDDPDAGAAQ